MKQKRAASRKFFILLEIVSNVVHVKIEQYKRIVGGMSAMFEKFDGKAFVMLKYIRNMMRCWWHFFLPFSCFLALLWHPFTPTRFSNYPAIASKTFSLSFQANDDDRDVWDVTTDDKTQFISWQWCLQNVECWQKKCVRKCVNVLEIGSNFMCSDCWLVARSWFEF